MASSHNIELEAARFLQKLIQDSKDEPAKLAMKLFVILQHMKASGKENSMPFQVISRAMETVVNQHGLDMEALKASRLPMTGDVQVGEARRGSAQSVVVAQDSKMDVAGHEFEKIGSFPSARHPSLSRVSVHDAHHGSVAHRSVRSLDHESPSFETRSANSHSQERFDPANSENQMTADDGKKSHIKRKRDGAGTSGSWTSSPRQVDNFNIPPNLARGLPINVGDVVGCSTKVGAFTQLHGGVPGISDSFPCSGLGISSEGRYCTLLESNHLLTKTQNNSEAISVKGSILTEKSTFKGDMWKHEFVEGSMSSISDKTAEGNQPVSSSFAREVSEQEFALSSTSVNANKKIARKWFDSKKAASRNCAWRPCFNRSDMHILGDPSNTLDVIKPTAKSSGLGENHEIPLGRPFTSNKKEKTCSMKETGIPSVSENVVATHDHSFISEGRNIGKAEAPMETHVGDLTEVEILPISVPQTDSSAFRVLANNNCEDHLERGNFQVGGDSQRLSMLDLKKEVTREEVSWIDFGSAKQVTERIQSSPCVRHTQDLGDTIMSPQSNSSEHYDQINVRNATEDAYLSENLVSGEDIKSSDLHSQLVSEPYQTNSPEQTANVGVGVPFTLRESSSEEDVEGRSDSINLLSSPNHTTLERWIMDCKKNQALIEQNWALKQHKADRTITSCFNKLKDTVSSAKDISAKTKSVIELKKLQLLQLQRRLKSDFLDDFFRPITSDCDRLKSFKKHKLGRRTKQVEKYEQKMKEERQRRIRERQKEFFSEIEMHKEKLEDAFKLKRERWKGLNRYVKEFHKRKERLYREKIDKIQRDKINLLKINDVEGYLRMVQDAKSDRVRQLLKETEKYLQKLGSKLQDAKAVAKSFELADNQIAAVIEKNETRAPIEDDSDQAKHYMESNEKYYLMAHSIKECIMKQPTSLEGGKLREYQMNGLRWLVSLYNNHLNGILADEMGLGKTVQVIALICYLMEMKNDRGPFLVVVPSSVLPGWESEISFWAPGINRILYSGPPEERRRLFKERIVHQKFNVLLTTYEYLMNKHDRPKLSKIYWHYVIIDEGHRIKNASCKLNADLKHYQSSHRLLLTGTPLQNNLDELWALLNFLLPNIFNSSEDFSQWFNKPFQSNGDNSPDETLLSEEENLLIINRLHQVLRPFVLRRLKHKVENELPEKIERLVRCEASAYQKLLIKRVEDNLGSIGSSKSRSIHNSVMELRNICNHPYLSQLHAEEVDSLIPKHFLPPVVRLCGKLEMLDRLLPKLKATDHRILFFSTMTRLLDVMEEYLTWKQYHYLRLDGHTSGCDRGALIEQFNDPDSSFFIFLLSIRAGGVGVNLQAADTVIIFDTDWNPQVDLQAQARAHRIGQKKDVLVLRLETVQTIEEQVRASAEHKLGVANQSITAGFFDNNTSAEDRREYLESLFRECKKEEAATVLDDDALNDLLARSESEIDIFESVDKSRWEKEMVLWTKIVSGHASGNVESVPPLPPRLVTDDDLKSFYNVMKIDDGSSDGSLSHGIKRKTEPLEGLDTQQYGRGKRAREVRYYEEQWTEEEFERMCLMDSPHLQKKDSGITHIQADSSGYGNAVDNPAALLPPALDAPLLPTPPSNVLPLLHSKGVTPPKRGRGRPKRTAIDASLLAAMPSQTQNFSVAPRKGAMPALTVPQSSSPLPNSATIRGPGGSLHPVGVWIAPSHHSSPFQVFAPDSHATFSSSRTNIPVQTKLQAKEAENVVGIPRKGNKQSPVEPTRNVCASPSTIVTGKVSMGSKKAISISPVASSTTFSVSNAETIRVDNILSLETDASRSSQSTSSVPSTTPGSESSDPYLPSSLQKVRKMTETSRGRGEKQGSVSSSISDALGHHGPNTHVTLASNSSGSIFHSICLLGKQENDVKELKNVDSASETQLHVGFGPEEKSLAGASESLSKRFHETSSSLQERKHCAYSPSGKDGAAASDSEVKPQDDGIPLQPLVHDGTASSSGAKSESWQVAASSSGLATTEAGGPLACAMKSSEFTILDNVTSTEDCVSVSTTSASIIVQPTATDEAHTLLCPPLSNTDQLVTTEVLPHLPYLCSATGFTGIPDHRSHSHELREEDADSTKLPGFIPENTHNSSLLTTAEKSEKCVETCQPCHDTESLNVDLNVPSLAREASCPVSDSNNKESNPHIYYSLITENEHGGEGTCEVELRGKTVTESGQVDPDGVAKD